MRRADRERLDRLAGDGNSVAGIDLAALFRVILSQIQDRGGVTTAGLVPVVQDALSNHARIEHLYATTPDPWPALIGDALTQLEFKKLAQRDEGNADLWRAGDDFTTGKRLLVIHPRRGKHDAVGVIVYRASERAERGEAEKRRMEITSLASSLREDGTGLRPLNPDHVETLAQSMRDFGYRPEFPTLIDQHGRILDGRHRRAAARRAEVTEPPPRIVRVSSDEEAVGLAILVNLQRGWTKAERSRIDADLQAAGLSVANFGQVVGTAAKRELIRAALLDDHERPNVTIAKLVGCSDHTVEAVRRELEETSQIARFTKPVGGRPRNDGTPAQPRQPALSPEQEEEVTQMRAHGATVPDVQKRFGVGRTPARQAVASADGRLAEQAKRATVGDFQHQEQRASTSTPPSDTPSWQMMAELFRRLPAEDQSLFLKAIGITR